MYAKTRLVGYSFLYNFSKGVGVPVFSTSR